MGIFAIMIRTILKSNKNDLTIKLPDNLVGKLIEIIAFEINEDKDAVNHNPKKIKPSQLRGFLSQKSSESMHDHINQSRSEWDTL
jgi:hypothetical protein